MQRGPWLHRIAGVLSAVGLGACGCVTGSLATDSGPSTVGPWSTAPRQDVHAGERVRFSMILQEPLRPGRVSLADWADYAVVSGLGERVELEPGADDRFEYDHLLEAGPGQTLRVTLAAFRIRGHRDYMRIRGEWRQSASPLDDADELMAEVAVALRVYQSHVDQAIPKPLADLDWTTARLLLTRSDGAVSAIPKADALRAGGSDGLPAGNQPEGPPPRKTDGFHVSGPDDAGRFRIQYDPTAEQVNKSGVTRAALHVRDVNQVDHAYEFDIATP